MKWLMVLPCVLSILACDHDFDPSMQPAAFAAITSLRFAEQDDVDLDVYSLYSIRRLRDGHQGAVDRLMTSRISKGFGAR